MNSTAQSTLAREHMLQSQILTGHVLGAPLLAALTEIRRELFVPLSLQGSAYVDNEIPLGNGRFLMEPLAFARMLEHANVTSTQTVLVVGSGTGYSAAVISRLAQKLVAVEEDNALAEKAKALLEPYPNLTFFHGLLSEGVSQEGPYDLIFIEGAIEFLPQPLADQLAEGGRLYTVEHEANARPGSLGLGKLIEYKKIRGSLYKTIIRDANAALLPAFRKPTSFVL